MAFFTTAKNLGQNPKPFLERFFLVVFKNCIKTILHGHMTEKIEYETKQAKILTCSFLKWY